MSSSNPLIEGKTARLQPSFQVHDFKNNESKINDKFLKKNWLTCSAGEVEGRTAPCWFPPNCLINWLSLLLSCSLATSHHSQCLFCFQIRTGSYIENVLAWHGHAWPFKRQSRIKKIGQSRMRRDVQDEEQSRLIWNLNEQGASGYYRFNDKDNGIELR